MIEQARKGRGFGHFHHTAYTVACAYSLMGRTADALQWLQDASDDGYPNYVVFERDRNLDALRRDPRFQQFMSRLRVQWERWSREL